MAHMIDYLPKGSGSPAEDAANSLFRNILPVSPCGSRFCGDSGRSAVPNFFKTNILEIGRKKNRDPDLTSSGTDNRLQPANSSPSRIPSPECAGKKLLISASLNAFNFSLDAHCSQRYIDFEHVQH
jgi:hypothetical protein